MRVFAVRNNRVKKKLMSQAMFHLENILTSTKTTPKIQFLVDSMFSLR